MGNTIPFSTNTVLIFPFDYSSYTFNTSGYNPMLTGNRMSIQEVNETLQNIHQTLLPFARKMRTAMWIYLLVVLIWLIAFLIFIIPGTVVDFFFVWIIYIVVLIIIAVVYRSYMGSVRQEAVSQVQMLIDRNNQVTISKGIRWSLPIRFPRWIELHIDSVGQFQQQGVYVPPVNQQYGGYDNTQQYQQNYYGGNQPAGYNPQQGGYNAQQGGYNVPQGGFNVQDGGYNPQQGGYNPQQNYI